MRSMLARNGWKMFRAWKSLQVSYCGGKYSIQRALALEAYTKNTSLLRVFLVCVKTLLPMIIVVFIQELIPLQDPRAGWKVNYGFWIRATVLLAVGVRALTIQATYFVDGVQISTQRQLLLSACVSVVMTAFSVTLASHVIFPIPFFVASTAPVMGTVHLLLFRAIMGNRIVHQMVAHRSQLAMYSNFVNAQAFMALMYPAYEALFRASEGSNYQLLIIPILPLLKLGMKNIVVRCTRQLEDMMPEAVIFTVDLFNSVYMATCMQISSSVATAITITVIDQTQTLIMLYGLHRRTATVLTRLREATGDIQCDNMLSALCVLCLDPEKYQQQTHSGIRKRSCLPQSLSSNDMGVLKMLDKIPSKASSITVRPSYSAQTYLNVSGTLQACCCCRPRRWSTSIYPSSFVHIKTVPSITDVEYRLPEGLPTSHDTSSAHRFILQETLETLFTTECLIIAAYLDFAIPLLYCGYILVMIRLPNSRYHSEMTEITFQNVNATILLVFLFGVLQIMSFAVLIAVIKRNCGVHALHQLAFVLETQLPLIRDKLVFWPIMTFCFRVVHFGVDFTFKFDNF